MENFMIRAYREETDLQPIHDLFCRHAERTAAYYLSGASPYPTLETISDLMRKESKQNHHPFIVTDPESRPFGIARTSNMERKCRHHHVSVHLWENPELTEAVLCRVLDRLLEGTAKMVVCQIPGYQEDFLTAARNVGMLQVGCIPDYVFYKSENGTTDIWPEYTFIMNKQNWLAQKEGGDKHDL